jgi:hypothetical protein
MISNWLSAALARRNIHYGWVMVGVTFFLPRCRSVSSCSG